MRIFRTLSLFIILAGLALSALSFASPSPSPSRPSANFRLCLQRANQKTEINARDEVRIACVRHFRAQLTVDECLKTANGFEYSTNSETMRGECLLNSSQITPAQCAKVAALMEYGSSRDELIWSCLETLNMSIGTKACRALARMMVYPAFKQRALLYCENEIKSSQTAPINR